MWGSPRPRLTILDLMTYKGEDWFTSLFDSFDNTTLPKQSIIDAIVSRCAYCDVIATDSHTFEFSVKSWAASNVSRYVRIYDAMALEYDPLHNYERWTIYQDKRKLSENEVGKENETESGNASENNTLNGTVINNSSENTNTSRSPYSNDNYYPYEHTDGSGNSSQTTNNKNVNTSNTSSTRNNNNDKNRNLDDDFVHNEFTQGDSGVNTPQDSLEQEWRLRVDHNIIDLIAKEFDYNMCLGVY